VDLSAALSCWELAARDGSELASAAIYLQIHGYHPVTFSSSVRRFSLHAYPITPHHSPLSTFHCPHSQPWPVAAAIPYLSNVKSATPRARIDFIWRD
jgi:hypothetical protein